MNCTPKVIRRYENITPDGQSVVVWIDFLPYILYIRTDCAVSAKVKVPSLFFYRRVSRKTYTFPPLSSTDSLSRQDHFVCRCLLCLVSEEVDIPARDVGRVWHIVPPLVRATGLDCFDVLVRDLDFLEIFDNTCRRDGFRNDAVTTDLRPGKPSKEMSQLWSCT